MNKIVNKYLIKGFLKTIFNVVLIFICLGIIMNLFEEIEFFKGLDNQFSLPFFLTFLFVPSLIIKLLPFIIFISSMWYLVKIKTNTDLLSLKVFGFSNLRIISVLCLTTFIFGIVVLFAINPITSSMIKYYEQKKSEYSQFTDHLFSINKNGVWIKENIISNNGSRIVTAKKFKNNFLFNVTVYELNKDQKLFKRIESEKVDINTNNWNLVSSRIFNISLENARVLSVENLDNYSLSSVYDSKRLNSLYKNLDTISFFSLLRDYKNLNQRGYSKILLNEKLNFYISLPVFLILMVVLAGIFTIGSVKKTQNIYLIFISIIACVLIYYFKDLSVALGQTNKIPSALAVWIPIVAIGLFCSIGVIQINEK